MHIRAISGAYGLLAEVEDQPRGRYYVAEGVDNQSPALAKAVILNNIQAYSVFDMGSPPLTRARLEEATPQQVWSYLEKQFSFYM